MLSEPSDIKCSVEPSCCNILVHFYCRTFEVPTSVNYSIVSSVSYYQEKVQMHRNIQLHGVAPLISPNEPGEN
jgi:hypothetical protein